MRKLYATVACATLLVTVMSVSSAQAKQNTDSNSAKSLGKTTLDTTVVADGDEMFYGDGISNGEWITATKQGVEIGMRATNRFDGLLDVTGTNGDRVGVYEASTGVDRDGAEWNYEFSVDLSGATGKTADTTLADYTLVMEQNFTSESLYGLLGTNPVSLPMVPGVCDLDALAFSDTLCQQSWNPTFGNDDFDPTATGTYDFRLILEPATFNGPPIAVAIPVNVTAPSPTFLIDPATCPHTRQGSGGNAASAGAHSESPTK
jgi:hypothetical protein